MSPDLIEYLRIKDRFQIRVAKRQANIRREVIGPNRSQRRDMPSLMEDLELLLDIAGKYITK